MDLSGVRFGPQIVAAARASGIEPSLLAAVAAQESGGPGVNSGNNIVGDAGHGHGVFQIDDRSWSFALTPAAMDPAKNAAYAASILHDDLSRYGGNLRMALSAYNTGSPTAAGTTTTWADGRRLGYADSVLRHEADLGVDPQQLQADNRETSAGVNALAQLGQQQVGPALSASLPEMPFQPTPTPTNRNGSQGQAATDVGAQADSAMAALIGGDDSSAADDD